ncbi:GMP synthase [glutamine-hydrolyzing] [archaeon HR06]|nr:GMP synthase [glutamine-hydrolyzing] [archaeon HR06]
MEPYNVDLEKLIKEEVKGIIFSGGPYSVYQEDAPICDLRIFQLKKPILGICYGLQLIAHLFGGKVVRGEKREYGKALLYIDDNSDLFQGLDKKIDCWMSHGDKVEEIPKNFEVIAHTDNSPFAAIRSKDRLIYGVQFHPEVAHTPKGLDILRNFVYKICKSERTWDIKNFLEEKLKEIKEKVGDEKVLCAVSGGVDSTTTAVLVSRAIGKNLTCIFVDHGLLRKNEAERVKSILKELGLNFIFVDAKKEFLSKLKGIKDPEEKRRIIGEEFIRIFTEKSLELGKFEWLAQGTLYPDVIESAKTGSKASKIKTHHNVGAIPDWMKFKLLEPLRELYKDEVRELARLLNIPDEIVNRHPFPGPGLAVRIIGEVNEEKLRICREACSIVEEELIKANWYNKVWQAFAFVGDDKVVGVLGDERKLGYIVTIRIVESVDAMTADWVRLPYELLAKISSRITNEIDGVTLVSYAISSKPPSTIEPQ